MFPYWRFTSVVFSLFGKALIAKFSDRKIWANSVDPDQTAILSASFGCIIIFVKPYRLKFRTVSAVFSIVQIFRLFNWFWDNSTNFCFINSNLVILTFTLYNMTFFSLTMPTDCWISKHMATDVWNCHFKGKPKNHTWATSWHNLFMPYGNNKGADQPVHLYSLIGIFV